MLSSVCFLSFDIFVSHLTGEPDPDSEKFDITLMVFLLRHLTDIKIYDELPLIHDKSEATAISRLKFYRNAYSHNSNGSVTRKEYANLVHVIVEVIILNILLKIIVFISHSFKIKQWYDESKSICFKNVFLLCKK